MSAQKHIITANHLKEGLNVYFSQHDGKNQWVHDFSAASIFETDGLEEALRQAKEDMVNNIIVDCYDFEVDTNGQPLNMREKIRANGPSRAYGHS